MSKKNQERLDAKYLAKQLRITPTVVDDSKECPDIVWSLRGVTIGLEITSGASSEHHRAEDLSTKGKAPFLMNVSHLHDRPERRTNDQIIESLSSIEYADATKNHRLWMDRVARKIEKKIQNLNREDFRIFDENWLLLFDRQAHFTDDMEDVRKDLDDRINLDYNYRSFDRIFIIGYPYFFSHIDGNWTVEEYRNET